MVIPRLRMCGTTPRSGVLPQLRPAITAIADGDRSGREHPSAHAAAVDPARERRHREAPVDVPARAEVAAACDGQIGPDRTGRQPPRRGTVDRDVAGEAGAVESEPGERVTAPRPAPAAQPAVAPAVV